MAHIVPTTRIIVEDAFIPNKSCDVFEYRKNINKRVCITLNQIPAKLINTSIKVRNSPRIKGTSFVLLRPDFNKMNDANAM